MTFTLPRLCLAILVAGGSWMVVGTATAQDAPATRPADREVDRPRAQNRVRAAQLDLLRTAAEACELTPEQANKVDEVLREAGEDLRRLRPGLRTLEPPERRERMLAFIASVEQEIRELLTNGQQPEFQKALRQVRRGWQVRPSPAPQAPQQDAVVEEPAPPAAGQLGRYVQRAVAAVNELDLNDEQRGRVRELADALREDLRTLAREHQDNVDELATAVRGRLQRFRREIGNLLTPEQRQQLQATLRQMRGDTETPPQAGAAMGGMAENTMGTEGMAAMAEGDFAPKERASAEDIAAGPTESRFLKTLTTPEGLAVGERIPEGLSVLSLQNRQIPLSVRFAEHRPTVVLLGSASSPTFRDRCGDMRWLLSQLRTPSGRTADIVVVYTREQYPAGEWDLERNEADGFMLPAHADAEQRVETASNLRRWANLEGPGLTVVADTMDDAVLTSLAGSPVAVGNFAFVFRADGTLAARQQWFDPTGISALVTEAAE